MIEQEQINEDQRNEAVAAVEAIGQFCVAVAQQNEQDRLWIEDEWLDDMRQVRGIPVDGEEDSDHRHNITKPKALTAIARISDLLFQAGDKNFAVGIDPDTPTERKPEALKGATQLEDKITTQLSDADYESVGRRVIASACTLGIGVIKGPVKTTGVKKAWVQLPDANGQVVNQLQMIKDTTSVTEFVPLWDYFPDMSAADHDGCANEFQRHYMSKHDLQKLLLRDDFNHEEIYSIIETETPSATPRYLTELRDNSLPEVAKDSFVVWEGYIQIPGDMIARLCQRNPERQGVFFSAEEEFEPDVECTIWISDSGKVLKFAPNPLETDERPFSTFCYDRDEACFMASPGVPRLMRDPARDVNSSWNRIHENSDLAVGPQCIVDTAIVEPMPEPNGTTSWGMEANKMYRGLRPGADYRKAFHFFNVPSNIAENMTILEKSRSFADEATMLPQIASGEQSAQMTKTFQGLELLMNASNTVHRRIVKDWDDYITVPLIGRYIDDNMQNSPEFGVFGQFMANARGTSALLLKETQARNLMSMGQVAESNAQFAQATKWLPLYRRVARGLQQDPDEFIKTDEEMEQEAQQQQEAPPNPEVMKLQFQEQKLSAELEFKREELGVKREIAAMEKETTMMKLEYEMLRATGAAKTRIVEAGMKGQQKQDEIVMGAKAKEHSISVETKAELAGGRNEVVI